MKTGINWKNFHRNLRTKETMNVLIITWTIRDVKAENIKSFFEKWLKSFIIVKNQWVERHYFLERYLNQQKKSDNIFYNVVIDYSFEGEKDKKYNK